MTKLTVNEKSGFEVIKSPVEILDFRGKPFYSTSQVGKERGRPAVEKFNLPEGIYILKKGSIKPTKFIEYKLPVLPFAERAHESPFNFAVKFGVNPHKCTIDWMKRVILFDNSMKMLTLPELYFILFHEYGHQKYATEKYADLYATKKLLQKGFNPSQIGSAPVTSLSHKQWDRKKHVVDHLVKLNS